jgi:hypothetical protein
MLHESWDSLHHLLSRLRLVKQVPLVGDPRTERDPSGNVGVEGTSNLPQCLSSNVTLDESAVSKVWSDRNEPEPGQSEGVLQVGLTISVIHT